MSSSLFPPVALAPLLQESCARCHRLHVPAHPELSHPVCPGCRAASPAGPGPAPGWRPR